ncbi:NYN domain-containing protein [Methanomethylophilus alvi]|uniref:NYN domain-containing protein n=1 Tax=Methanomethylophilus alvi TaxID=1291540 RepID=UPI0037DC815F
MNTIENSQEMQKTVNPYRNTENDRVLVVLDVRNITARQNQDYCNARIDYGKLLTDTVDGRILIGAIAVDSLIEDSDGRDSARIFHRELKNSGFRLDLVPPSNNKGKQEGVDVKIALLAQKYVLRGQCDVVELITGDGDFTVLVQSIQSEGVRAYVTSFYKSLSYSLRNEADLVRILDNVPIIRMHPGTHAVKEAA